MALNRGKVRIIGGQWRHRVLSFSDHSDLRPTPNRVRETVFNWLGQDLSSKVCLDLFTGSGAMGFEAASRGAKHVVMVESNPNTINALQANIKKLKSTQVELIMMDALTFIKSDTRQYDVIFVDPPYQLDLIPKLLSLLPSHLTNSGQVYIESKNYLLPDKSWRVRRTKQVGRVFFSTAHIIT